MVSVALYFVRDSIDELAGWNVPDDLMLGAATYRELAKTVAFLISDDAKYITGATIEVNEASSTEI